MPEPAQPAKVKGRWLQGESKRWAMVERDAPLNRRIEEASLNAWPALHQMLLDGWVLRFARGFTKRANSVTPLYPGGQPIEDKVRFCENLYARERLQSVFRIADDAALGPLDRCLAGRGYRRADPTQVLSAPVAAGSRSPRWSLLTRREWLDAYAALTGLPAKLLPLHGAILNAIRTECAHAALGDGNDPLACGLGVVERGLIGLFDIATHPAHRRQGLGAELVGGLLAWGRNRGAATAYLQVGESNAPARSLYAKLGFAERYRYWYRIGD